MNGRVCVVTGASSGIGLETARELARRGATVVLVCRDRARGEAACREVDGELVLADLAVQAQVRAAAEEIRERLDAIHVLVNNAGVYNRRRRETPDGIEETFAVNHLAPFLLTNLLLDRLRAGAPARVVAVASAAHLSGHVDFDDLEGRARYSAWGAYAQSKLANVLFAAELARRCDPAEITSNALHPGFVRSNFARNNGPLAKVVMLALTPATISPRRAARTPVHLACAPERAGVTGRYFVDCEPAAESAEARDPGVAARLWEVSEALTATAPGTRASAGR